LYVEKGVLMTDSDIRNNISKMLREIRKQGYSAPRRQTISEPLLSDNNQDYMQFRYYKPEHFNKVTIEMLLEGCKDTDWIRIEAETDYDGERDGYAATVMRLSKETDAHYNYQVLKSYETCKQNDKVLALKQRAIAAGVDLNYYQSKVLLEYVEEMNRKVIV